MFFLCSIMPFIPCFFSGFRASIHAAEASRNPGNTIPPPNSYHGECTILFHCESYLADVIETPSGSNQSNAGLIMGVRCTFAFHPFLSFST